MKKILEEAGYDLFQNADSPSQLARKVLNKVYSTEISVSDLPIDPFNILKSSGVKYTLSDFDKLEGLYLLPDDIKSSRSFGIVGINKNRPISRQRFTAAHELCHHLKDCESVICKQGDRDEIEIFANKFAAELLIPTSILASLIQEMELTHRTPDSIFLGKVLSLSVLFGVSFQSILIKVSTMVNKKFSSSYENVRKKFKPESKKKEMGLNNDYTLYRQLFDSIEFVGWNPTKKVQNDFLRLLIVNDHRMENGNLEVSEISEVIARIRFSDDNSFKDKLNDSELDVLGQYNMYSLVFKEFERSKVFTDLILLHKELYRFSRFPDAGGTFRNTVARINQKTVKTNDPRDIAKNMFILANGFENILDNLPHYTNSDLLDIFVKNHHDFTIIHPFIDGNGRTSRAYLNKKLYSCGLPLFYVKSDEKAQYQQALEKCDNSNDYRQLFVFFVKVILNVHDKIIKPFAEKEWLE